MLRNASEERGGEITFGKMQISVNVRGYSYTDARGIGHLVVDISREEVFRATAPLLTPLSPNPARGAQADHHTPSRRARCVQEPEGSVLHRLMYGVASPALSTSLVWLPTETGQEPQAALLLFHQEAVRPLVRSYELPQKAQTPGRRRTESLRPSAWPSVCMRRIDGREVPTDQLPMNGYLALIGDADKVEQLHARLVGEILLPSLGYPSVLGFEDGWKAFCGLDLSQYAEARTLPEMRIAFDPRHRDYKPYIRQELLPQALQAISDARRKRRYDEV